MARIIFFRWMFLIGLTSTLSSCLKVPMELTIKEPITMSEAEVKTISDNIYEKLSELDFKHPTGAVGLIDPAECSKAYKVWLRKQFDIGYLPTNVILPSEYAQSSGHPKINECRTIDFNKEYEDAISQSSEKNKRDGLIIGFNKFREKLIDHKCSERFIDLDREKIAILGIDLIVLKNSISIKPPRFKLYTSFDEITEAKISKDDAEETLVKNGTLTLLGETMPIPAQFTGTMPIKLNENREDFRFAEAPLVSLDGSLLAFPSALSTEPEIVPRNGQSYFVLPQGEISITISLAISTRFTTDDALCALEQLKASIEEDEAKRKQTP